MPFQDIRPPQSATPVSSVLLLRWALPAPPAHPAAHAEPAIKPAKSAGATLLLEGPSARAEPGTRITIQSLDLRPNQCIAAAKATGPLAELFAREDSIADQVKRLALEQV